MLKIDNTFLNKVGIKNEYHENIKLKKTENGEVEVALGSYYKGIFQIGDTFMNGRTKVKYVVKDFLSPQQRWFADQIYNDSIISLDNYVIMPFDLTEYTDISCMVYTNNIFINIPHDMFKVSNEIEELGSKSKNIYRCYPIFGI